MSIAEGRATPASAKSDQKRGYFVEAKARGFREAQFTFE